MSKRSHTLKLKVNAGEKFKACVQEVKRKGGAKSPAGVCASAGRKKYGKKKFQAMAAAGKRANPIGPLATIRQGKETAKVYKKLKGYEVRITHKGETKSFPASTFKGAMGIGRIRLASPNPLSSDDMFNLIPGFSTADKLTRKAFSGKRSKNPIDAAAKVYEDFHGEPSKEVLEYIEQEHRHGVTAGIGKLVGMKITTVTGKNLELLAPDPDGKLSDVVQVTISEDGRQLFFIGGDQSLDLKALGMTAADQRDHMLIGTITELTYRTRKSFDKGELVDYFHKFGREGSQGVMPILLYNPRSKTMKVAGGRYEIAKPEKWLKGVSPGIIG